MKKVIDIISLGRIRLRVKKNCAPNSNAPQAAEAMLRIKQAAEKLSCCEATIRRMIKTGKLRAHRFSSRMTRIAESDLAQCLNLL